jgi:hypothetical protein
VALLVPVEQEDLGEQGAQGAQEELVAQEDLEAPRAGQAVVVAVKAEVCILRTVGKPSIRIILTVVRVVTVVQTVVLVSVELQELS